MVPKLTVGFFLGIRASAWGVKTWAVAAGTASAAGAGGAVVTTAAPISAAQTRLMRARVSTVGIRPPSNEQAAVTHVTLGGKSHVATRTLERGKPLQPG